MKRIHLRDGSAVYLDATADLHNGVDYIQFVALVGLIGTTKNDGGISYRVTKRSVAERMHMSRPVFDKVLMKYESEQ